MVTKNKKSKMANLYTPKKKSQGLSQLQRRILDMANAQGGEVLARDILIDYYGFKPYRNPQELNPGALVFRKSDIGHARYNAATVTVCKALNRLCERGLAKRIRSGISIG
jgi:hypothetical protein